MTTAIGYQTAAPGYQFPPQRSPVPTFNIQQNRSKHHPQQLNFRSPSGSGSVAFQQGSPAPGGQYLNPAPQSQAVHSYSQMNYPSQMQTLAAPSYHLRQSSTSTMGTSTTNPNSAALYRTHSNASNTSNSAYVMTLRKQKATVWCERSQKEDARLLAAQKAAKQRAAMEVAGVAPTREHSSNGQNSLHKSNGKIRHHGVTGGMKRVWNGSGSGQDSEFNTNMNLVAGMPARLDIEDDSTDDEAEGRGSASGSISGHGGISRKTGSGKSSINSVGRRRYTPGGQMPPQVQVQQTPSPGSFSRTSSLLETSVPEGVEIKNTVQRSPRTSHMQPQQSQSQSQHQYRPSMNIASPAPTASFDSSSSGESVTKMPSTTNGMNARPAGKDVHQEIRRRGSVDEMNARTLTMSGVRLFVANPDQ